MKAKKRLEKLLKEMSLRNEGKFNYEITNRVNFNFPDHCDVRLDIFCDALCVYSQNLLHEKSKLPVYDKTLAPDIAEVVEKLCKEAILEMCLTGALGFKDSVSKAKAKQKEGKIKGKISWLRLEYDHSDDTTAYSGSISPFVAVSLLTDAMMVFRTKRIDEIKSEN